MGISFFHNKFQQPTNHTTTQKYTNLQIYIHKMCTMLISTQIHHPTMRAIDPISSYYQTFVIVTPTFLFHFLPIIVFKDDSLSLTFFLFLNFQCFAWCTFCTNLMYLFKILIWVPLVSSLHMIIFAS
jgi:hypothetical protein